MIKKSINRRSEKESLAKPSTNHRYEQATKTVVKQYRQDKETTVYTKYFEHKKTTRNGQNTTEANSGGL